MSWVTMKMPSRCDPMLWATAFSIDDSMLYIPRSPINATTILKLLFAVRCVLTDVWLNSNCTTQAEAHPSTSTFSEHLPETYSSYVECTPGSFTFAYCRLTHTRGIRKRSVTCAVRLTPLILVCVNLTDTPGRCFLRPRASAVSLVCAGMQYKRRASTKCCDAHREMSVRRILCGLQTGNQDKRPLKQKMLFCHPEKRNDVSPERKCSEVRWVSVKEAG